MVYIISTHCYCSRVFYVLNTHTDTHIYIAVPSWLYRTISIWIIDNVYGCHKLGQNANSSSVHCWHPIPNVVYLRFECGQMIYQQFLWSVITHPCPNLNGAIAKPGGVTSLRSFRWMYLLVHGINTLLIYVIKRGYWEIRHNLYC